MIITIIRFLFLGFLLIHKVASRHLYNEGHRSDFNMSWLFDLENQNSKISKDKICLKDTCQNAAQDILNGIDSLIDPCEDFYTYVCGRWIRNHPVPPTENNWNQFEIINKRLNSQLRDLLMDNTNDHDFKFAKKAKKIFHACMNTKRIEKRGLAPLVKLLEELNGWPIATSDWKAKNFNWQKLIGDVNRKVAVDAILLLYVDVDRKNTSRNVLIVDEPSLGLPKYLLTDTKSDYILPYITYITEAAQLIAKARNDIYFPFNLYYQSFNMIRFETRLSRFMKKEEDKKKADDLYHLVTIQKLQQWTDHRAPYHSVAWIDWKPLIQNHLGALGKEITDDTQIVVTNWEYLEKLIILLKKTPPNVLANYILWRVVDSFSKDLNEEMANLRFQFKKELSAITEDQPRWYNCIMAARYMSFAVGYMYVTKHFSDEGKTKATNMVENIRSAFKQELKEVPWMDEETRNQAIEKADIMNTFIGYPNWYKNVSALETYYDGVEVGENHFENKVALLEFLGTKIWSNINDPTDRDEWSGTPAIANAFYDPQQNSIMFPAGVLQDPFFNKDLPEALNYGAIGSIMGHEISHGFDNLGRQSDKFGNVKEWWSKETEETFLDKSKCFINQYNNYRVPELDSILNKKVTMNGKLTLGENIADNGGLRAALRAYQKHKKRMGDDIVLPGLEEFTSEQLFYIGFARVWCESLTNESLFAEVMADPHAPHRLRVIGSISNLDHFTTTWKCKRGSNMNPKKKCKIW